MNTVRAPRSAFAPYQGSLRNDEIAGMLSLRGVNFEFDSLIPYLHFNIEVFYAYIHGQRF